MRIKQFFMHTHSPNCHLETDHVISALLANGQLVAIPDPEKRLQEMEQDIEDLEIQLAEARVIVRDRRSHE